MFRAILGATGELGIGAGAYLRAPSVTEYT
jgi:hypothetical protein